jgi:hypothetical protein
MKHILNNLSNEEKNSIREQHTGGMKVMTENFSRLMNAKLGDAKPLVSEQSGKPQTTGTVQRVPPPVPPQTTGTVQPKPPVPPTESKFNDKTVNLYYDSNNKDFLNTEKINYIKKNSSDRIILFLARGGELTFSCLDKTLEYSNNIKVYNTPLTNELIKTFCTTSSGGTSVPKADFAVNSSNTNANFT